MQPPRRAFSFVAPQAYRHTINKERADAHLLYHPPGSISVRRHGFGSCQRASIAPRNVSVCMVGPRETIAILLSPLPAMVHACCACDEDTRGILWTRETVRRDLCAKARAHTRSHPHPCFELR